MAARRLVIHKETLAELGTEELTLVAGAQVAAISKPVGDCLLAVTSKVVECDSYLRPCISHTCTI